MSTGRLGHLEDDGVALAPARADRRAAEPTAAAAQLEDQAAENARARSADWVAQRDRAAVYVDSVLLDAQHADRVQGDGREGLVDLPQVDVLRLQAGFLQRLASGARGSRREIREVVRALSVRDDLRQRRLAVRLRPLLRGQHERAGAVVDARRVARGVRTILA